MLRDRVPTTRGAVNILGHLLALTLLTSSAAQAQYLCNPTCSPDKYSLVFGRGYYFDANVPANWQADTGFASTAWNNMHAGYGHSEMYVNPETSGIRIVIETPISDPTATAEYSPGDDTIRISPDFVNTATEHYRRYVMMHELGHALGFADVTDPACHWETIMSNINDPDFTTQDWCAFNYYYDPVCEAGGGEDYYNHCTPLVLTFAPKEPLMSKANVPFDIAGNGDSPLVGWPHGRKEGLLALDRDGDGAVGSGRELFGNVTPLARGSTGRTTWNGFHALAFFDSLENGGNHNGRLDPEDSIYEELLVWFDRNRDGVSQTDELVRLASLGVESIPFNAFAINKTDSHGNLLWFGNSFTFKTSDGVKTRGTVVDVIPNVRRPEGK